MIAATTRFLARLKGDQRGVSAVEFAFIAPVMILFYFGMTEACQVMLAERRTVRTASAIGDLIAQSPATVTATGSGGLDDILSMGNTLMSPFTTGASLKICVASISADVNNIKHVDWIRTSNGATCPAKGSVYTLVPSALIAANGSVIMATVSYTYSDPSKLIITKTPTFTRTYYHEPRKVANIACPTC